MSRKIDKLKVVSPAVYCSTVLLFFCCLFAFAGEDGMPLSLPDELPGGEKSFLKGSVESWKAGYSRGVTITVYAFHDSDNVADSLDALARVGERVDEEVSETLARAGAVLVKDAGFMSLSFPCRIHLVRIAAPVDAMTEKDLVRSGELVMARYARRERMLFSTPEAVMRTFIVAVKERNMKRILMCVLPPGDEDAAKFAERLESGLSAASNDGNRRHYGRRRFEIASKVEEKKMESATSAVVRVDSCTVGENVWWNPSYWSDWSAYLAALIEVNTSSEMMRGTGTFWIPFTKVDGLWKIDFAELKERAFFPTKDACKNEKHVHECKANLSRLSYAIRNTTKYGRLPADFEKLAKKAGCGGGLSCPAGPQKPEDHEGFFSNYQYETYYLPYSRLPAKTVVVYCGKGWHKRKGEGRMVLFADATVRWVAEERFQDFLRESRKLTRDNEVAQKIHSGEDVELTAGEERFIRATITQLGDDDWRVRKRAHDRLLVVGFRCYNLLKEYENSDDLEIRTQVKRLMRYFK